MYSDLKPENLLYLTSDPNSALVLADFGIAKTLQNNEVLTTMAGSFGYAAPEIMLKKGHGKPVDMWSLGVITYTLLCGYSPFRSENLNDLIEECKHGIVVFHERYWKDVSKDAKEFIMTLLQPDPRNRAISSVSTSSICDCLTDRKQEALKHRWLSGTTATDHDLLPEIRAYIAKARLRRGVEIVKLANSIEWLKQQEDPSDNDQEDLPSNARQAAGEKVAAFGTDKGLDVPSQDGQHTEKKKLSNLAKGAIFREIVLAKVREVKEREKVERAATEYNKTIAQKN